MPYRRVGSSGLLLPAISLGLWYNFGDNRPFDGQREVLRYAFDRGITHFDLANNYGPPYGSAEENFGRMLRRDFKPYRNELIISTKAGWDMWPGPYGQLGGRAYLLASLDESLDRLGLDYVDIFYSHRIDPVTPLDETIGALDTAVRAGKARYVGISSYSAGKTAEAAAIARRLGTPLVIHQPSYSLLNRWIEGGLTDRARQRRYGRHRVHRAGPRPPDGPLPAAAGGRHRARDDASDLRRRPGDRAGTRSGYADSPGSPNAAASRWRSWRWPGCFATPLWPRRSSARLASPSSTRISEPSPTFTSRRTNSAKSTGTHRIPASTCGARAPKYSRASAIGGLPAEPLAGSRA